MALGWGAVDGAAFAGRLDAVADAIEGGKDSGKKHTDRRIKLRLAIMKGPGVLPMAPVFDRD